MTALKYYEHGKRCLAHGNYLDACVLFSKAVRLDPQNKRYAQARERLILKAAKFEKGLKKGVESTLEHSDFCCECCGEFCFTGLCELLCESCDCG